MKRNDDMESNEDATGGKAIRELGYEPVEENENLTKMLNGDE